MDTLVAISDSIWNPMAYVALAVGLFFTVLTAGVQFRRIPDMLREITAKRTSEEGISPVQALLLTLSSRVGVGNIAGVATAIAAGGPGALVWMALCALLGSAAAFAETVLAQVYKRKVAGEHRGGIPFYVEHGLKVKWLAVVLAVVTLTGYGFVFPGVQSNNIAASVEGAFGVQPWVTAVAVTALFAFVIVGGTRRIVAAAQVMVPVMAIGYLLTAAIILVVNLDSVVPALGVIVSSAVGTHQVFGGIVGAAVAWGVRRAVFSNVAGVGEGTFGAAASAVSHPAKQGLVQAFSIFVDTLLVCTATGVMIVVTGSYNVVGPDGADLVTNVPGLSAGPEYTQRAVDTMAPGIGPGFVAVALFLFAFTTLIAFYYIASTNLLYLLSGRAAGWASHVLKAGMLAITFYGAVESADVIWTIGDIGYGSLGWLNMICLLLLSPVVRKVIRDYDAQRKQGLDPQFDPVRLGITGADFWTDTVDPATQRSRPAPDSEELA
ncbi:alanine/glycine:cation symporter family protein [Saccharomonospora xinjiangensis]|uniref:Amino acid carrier protein n=1 Tax=Saccharomonospora xinjiangensis XJ-54 TaxID=882086 RepID=I0UYU8_9PSEU|nr:alanine/glycine:cation symporter family protein [Saccharomonospora xinjiangensis]EID53051.1 amino acid carrier protein [Saccharomonospora xinjiangensis XJ-54]